MIAHDPANGGKQVMPELAFELEEIFRTRLFSFPLDDHESAREIFRYLLDKGVPEDELAHVIQSSTNSMTLWLYRTGLKKMLGEWIISWINRCYDQYLQKEATARAKSKQMMDFQQSYKENCVSQRDRDRKSRRGNRETLMMNHRRNLSKSETNKYPITPDDVIQMSLNESSQSLKFYHDTGKQSPHLYLHLMYKNIVSILKKTGGIATSLVKLQSPSSLQDHSTTPGSFRTTPLGSSYNRSNSFPTARKWKHFKLKTEYPKYRMEKRDSGIFEDFDSSCCSENSTNLTSNPGPRLLV